MVKNPVRPVIVRVRPSNYTNQWKILTVSSGNRIENTEPTHSESNNTCADSPRPRVAVSSVPGVEFVAAADVGEPGLGDEVVEQSQVKVTGDSENVGDADLDESAREVATKSGVAGVDHGRGGRALDCRSGAVREAPDVGARRLADIEGSDLCVHGRYWVMIVLKNRF